MALLSFWKGIPVIESVTENRKIGYGIFSLGAGQVAILFKKITHHFTVLTAASHFSRTEEPSRKLFLPASPQGIASTGARFQW
jgi:hypothetical protein